MIGQVSADFPVILKVGLDSIVTLGPIAVGSAVRRALKQQWIARQEALIGGRRGIRQPAGEYVESIPEDRT